MSCSTGLTARYTSCTWLMCVVALLFTLQSLSVFTVLQALGLNSEDEEPAAKPKAQMPRQEQANKKPLKLTTWRDRRFFCSGLARRVVSFKGFSLACSATIAIMLVRTHICIDAQCIILVTTCTSVSVSEAPHLAPLSHVSVMCSIARLLCSRWFVCCHNNLEV